MPLEFLVVLGLVHVSTDLIGTDRGKCCHIALKADQALKCFSAQKALVLWPSTLVSTQVLDASISSLSIRKESTWNFWPFRMTHVATRLINVNHMSGKLWFCIAVLTLFLEHVLNRTKVCTSSNHSLSCFWLKFFSGQHFDFCGWNQKKKSEVQHLQVIDTVCSRSREIWCLVPLWWLVNGCPKFL